MSRFEEFQRSLAKGREAAAQQRPPDVEVEQQIAEFFRHLLLDFNMPPKKMKYVDLDQKQAIPLLVEEAPRAPTQISHQEGERAYDAAIELNMPGMESIDAPVWLRFRFLATTEGLRAVFNGRSVIVPQEAKALFDFVAETLNQRLSQPPSFLPIKLGF